MFIRSKLLGLNKNKNLQCVSLLKTYKRLLTQGQFKKRYARDCLFEQILLWWQESMNNVICCPPYWISIHECIISTSRKLEKSSLHMWLSGQKRKQLTLDLFCQLQQNHQKDTKNTCTLCIIPLVYNVALLKCCFIFLWVTWFSQYNCSLIPLMSEFRGPICQEMHFPVFQFSKIFRSSMPPRQP